MSFHLTDGGATPRVRRRRPGLGPDLVLKLSAPRHTVAFWNVYTRINFLLCFCNGASQITLTDGELDGDESFVIVAVNECRTGNRSDFCNFLEGYHAAVHGRDLEFLDLLLCFSVGLLITDTYIELLLLFEKPGGGFTTNGHFDYRFGIFHIHSVCCHF